PGIGTELSKGGEFGVIESVKAASDVYAPLSGEVLEINGDLSDHPEFINQSPYEKGWMIVMKIKDKSEAGELMSSGDYESYVRKILEESE
ncbi:glycine cleavage system protein H, partial [Candidatus Aerophobetes bacterium]